MNTITDEQLKELVDLAPFAQTLLPIATIRSNPQLNNKVIRAREKYRRLSFEFAGDLAREILELRARLKESVSVERTMKE
jgi:hypothetical protein